MTPRQSQPTIEMLAANKYFTLGGKLTLKVVGGDTSTNVAQIKGTLSVDGATRVPVGDKHLRERQAVKGASVHEVDVMDGDTLSPVEANSESPLLPLNQIALHGERGTLGLDDIVGLHGGTRRVLLKTVVILRLSRIRVRLGDVSLGDGLIRSERKANDLLDLHGTKVDRDHEVQRERVVRGVDIIVLGIFLVKKDLGVCERMLTRVEMLKCLPGSCEPVYQCHPHHSPRGQGQSETCQDRDGQTPCQHRGEP